MTANSSNTVVMNVRIINKLFTYLLIKLNCILEGVYTVWEEKTPEEANQLS